MKKSIFYKVVLLAVLAIFITACPTPVSSDDDIVVLPPLTIDDVLALVNANYTDEQAGISEIKAALEAAKSAGDVNTLTNGYTSLMLAAQGNNLEVDDFVSYEDIVKALLRVDGCEINAKKQVSNNNIHTALLFAIERQDVAVTEALLKAGAKHDISLPTASTLVDRITDADSKKHFVDLLSKYPNN